MKNAFVDQLTKLARKNRNVMLLTGDLGFNLFEKFSTQLPHQFINIGVAESNMIGVASGLAMAGKIPFVYSIATFATMRPFEQIRLCIAVHNLHVVVVGSGAGYSYGSAGVSHHALEDISLMRTIPNMKVLCPADAWETAWATQQALRLKTPVYLRLGKRGEPKIYNTKPALKLGKCKILKRGKHVAVLATGNMVTSSLEAWKLLKKRGIRSSIFSVHTVKPIDYLFIRRLIKKYSYIVTVEEHFITGGLGSAVSEVLSSTRSNARLLRIGVPDVFIQTCGSQNHLRQKVGLHPKGITDAIRKFLS